MLYISKVFLFKYIPNDKHDSVTLYLGQRLVLAGRQLLFVNNGYAYLFIRAHQPRKYQRKEDN